ncbi:fibroblast growth factor 20-like protein precursor [Saccoglossus kowalevskii]|uniref:Fibroblast growth factor n=1 Tax=Saccoglossus kowalevskii TaxID=10224 RepID=D2XMS4_SACKO|nr:fibroblast growth factor 20-like protein precursor [Saccoglossus kowalevskii]ADB22411.1 fibroblast growth factor 20-like protein [Saccoglossus kowalevskii]
MRFFYYLVVLGLTTLASTSESRAVSTELRNSREVPLADDDGELEDDCVCRSVSPKANLKAYRDALNYRQLYCLTGYHLQILPDGTVNGTRKDHNLYAIMLIETIRVGVITIKGVKTSLYLSMNNKGKLYGSRELTEESYFYERLIEDWYLTYASHKHPNTRRGERKRQWFVGLTDNGLARKGSRSRSRHVNAHFRTRPVDPVRVPNIYDFAISELKNLEKYSNTKCRET